MDRAVASALRVRRGIDCWLPKSVIEGHSRREKVAVVFRHPSYPVQLQEDRSTAQVDQQERESHLEHQADTS